VANELGITLTELRTRMTATEVLAWNAFYNIRAEQERKAIEAAKRRR